MLKETNLTVQTCDLKVDDISCDECMKKIYKIMHKIDGVYQTNVNRQEGKVTLIGLLDMDTVFKRLKKAGMSAQLWDANSTAVSEHPKFHLGGSDMGDQLKDASGKGQPQGEASSSGGCAAGSGGGTNDETMVLPLLTPTPEQHVPNIQQQIEQRLQMLKGEKQIPPHLMGMPPAINRGRKSGKKVGGGTKVLVPGNANNDNKNDVGTKLYQDAGDSQVKNGAIGQPPHNGALGSQMMGGSMTPQKKGMMRPPNNMIGPSSFPMMGQGGMSSMGPYTHLDGYNMQPYGGSDAVYPSGAASSGMLARNPMPQPYMPQQEHGMMMNAHYPHSQNARYGANCTGYQLMGYDNGHGRLQQQYPPPMYYPKPLPPQHDNIFSEENPNICSLM